MLINKNNGGYVLSGIINSDIYVLLDETTEEGRYMAEIYVDNYPLVAFNHDGQFVTSVTVIELEKPQEVDGKEIDLLKNENGEWEYVYVDIPLTKEQELELKLQQQDAVIEEILFEIIPNMGV